MPVHQILKKPLTTVVTGLLALTFQQKCLAVSGGIPSHIFSRDDTATTTIVVDKSAKSAYLVKLNNDQPELIQEYNNLLLGGNQGDKIMEGDKRTPEGIYQITGFIPDHKLDARYGSGAFPLNYPNPLDKIEGKNGSGIWLHGRDDNDQNKIDTRGCVAFANNQIGELEHLLKEGARVIITQNAEFVDSTEYIKQRRAYFNVLDEFLSTWQNGDMQTLASWVHPDFSGESRLDRSQWLKKKHSLNKLYPKRTIKANNVVVLKENEDQVTFNFRQFYCAKNIVSHGQKNLFFKKNGDQLKLITESFSRLDAAPVIEQSVNQFIANWSSSWQNKNLDAYIEHYSGNFVDNKGRDIEAWRNYKTRVFSSRTNQHINLSDLQIKALAGDKYRVRFKQAYDSLEYSDNGWKTLILEGCPGSFRIAAESWSKT